MNEQDVARYAYYKMMYSDDMYDMYGNYKFDLADKKRAEFIKQFGSDVLEYIKEYSASRWDEPPEMRAFREAKKILEPYWSVEDWAWSQVQNGDQLKKFSDQIRVIERTDPDKAKQLLKRFPQN